MASSDNKALSLERQELWGQLANAINMRSAQDQVLWSIFGTFWAANAILLVALFTTGTMPTSPVVGIVVSIVGAVLSSAWYAMQARALGHLMRYEELIKRIENKLNFDPEYAISAEINRQAYDQYLGKGPRARKLMKACSIIGAASWVVACGFFLGIGRI
jgi:hypothetical protein